MKARKAIASKIFFVLLAAVFFTGQIPVCSHAAQNPYNNLNISVTKTIDNMNPADPGKYYLGQLVKATYTITSNEIELTTPKEIAFVIDFTYSMTGATSDGESKLNAMKKVLLPFLDYWKDQKQTKICIIGFGQKVFYESGLINANSTNIDNLKNVVSGLPVVNTSGTNLGDGLRVAYHTLNNSGNQNARKYIITLTDGMPNKYTANSNGQFYKDNLPVGTNGISVMPSGFVESDGINYASEIMGVMRPEPSFKNFLIGFGIEATQANNLNIIGSSGGLSPVGDVTGDNISDYFYRPTTASELSTVLTAIANSIGNEIMLTTANITDITSDTVTLPTDMDPFKDINANTLKGATDVIRSYDEDGNQIGNSQIVIPLKLKLVRTHDNFFAIEKIEFSIYYRVASAGQVLFPKPNGEFEFTDPITGTPVNKSSTGNAPKVSVKQTVDSVYIPPQIMFTKDIGDQKINAIINPAPELDTEDKYIKSWTVKSGTNLIEISDNPSTKDTSAKITTKNSIGIAEVTGTSSGPGFGGKNTVDGFGKVIILEPSIDKVTVDLGKSADTGLKFSIPSSLTNEINQIMKDYTKKQSFVGFLFKICPVSSINKYFLGIKSPVDKNTSSVIQGDSFPSLIGNWTFTPYNKDGEQYYIILNKGSLKAITALVNGNVCQYDVFNPALSDNQLWKIEEMEDGYYRITSRLNQKCLQIRNLKNINSQWKNVIDDPGTDLVTGVYNGYSHQKWALQEVDYSGSSLLSHSILENIQIVVNNDGTPAAKVSDASKNQFVKVTFATKPNGTTDFTTLRVLGKKPTLIDKGKGVIGKICDPIEILVTVQYKNTNGITSKTNVKLLVDIIDFIDIT